MIFLAVFIIDWTAGVGEFIEANWFMACVRFPVT